MRVHLATAATLGVALLLASLPALGDSSPPATRAECTPPSPSVTAEIERLFASVAGHSTHSELCVDGDGHRVGIDHVRACAAPAAAGSGLAVAVSYRATVSYEVGGECSPYPDCAKPPPPTTRDGKITIRLTRTPEGLKIVVPREVPGLELLMGPLEKSHSTGCYGEIPAFVPKAVPRSRRRE